MTLTNYTIATERNSYFNGRDAILLKDGERVATLALKDDQPAVKVKVYHWGTDASKVARAEVGELACERIADSIADGFWFHTAIDLANDYGFGKVWSAGRSGGWAVPESTDDKWWQEIAISSPFPEWESIEELFERGYEERLHALRYRFFEFAEALTVEVEYLRTEWFDELVEEERQCLEYSREAVLVRGEN